MAHIIFIDSNESGIAAIACAKAMGHQVTFVKSRDYAFFQDTPETRAVLNDVDFIIEVPVTSDQELVYTALAPHVELYPADVGISQCDGAIETSAVVFERLGIPFTPSTGVKLARHKDLSRQALADAGLANAQFRLVNSIEDALKAADEIGYPVVVKPPSGLDSIQVSVANDPIMLAQAAQSVLDAGKSKPRQLREIFERGVLVEEVLRGKIVSVEIGLRNQRAFHFMCSGRFNTDIDECIPMGVTMPEKLADDERERCFEYAENVCRALGLTLGVFHIELMITPHRGPILIEANARLMGGVMPSVYKKITGEKIEAWMINIFLGVNLDKPLPIPNSVAMVRRVIARKESNIQENFNISDIDNIVQDSIHNVVNYNMYADVRVKEHELLGRFITIADSHEKAFELAELNLNIMSHKLGIELVHTAIP
ncbi:ATP-grasp domain-containing protein [Pantoea stewartii]|uniref:ATP-grasp domain-containing protein n=1 Tax=Pantoea stewartii TaxID=66269 RepID=UPI0024BD99E3|nr:ATP-grasp domain-containing protein [Pantoea stewartii]